MQKIKNIMLLQKVSIVLSIVAFVFSLISIISINKLNNDVVNIMTSEGKGFNLIGKVPDVEIIRPDGSIDKIKANESKDKLGDIIENKVGKKIEKNEAIKQVPLPVKKDDKKKDNISKNNNKKQMVEKSNILRNNVIDKNSNEVVFYIQVGAFTKEEMARKQCKNIKNFVVNVKKCIVSKKGNMFKSIIAKFKDKKEAYEFLDKNNLKGIVKKQ